MLSIWRGSGGWDVCPKTTRPTNPHFGTSPPLKTPERIKFRFDFYNFATMVLTYTSLTHTFIFSRLIFFCSGGYVKGEAISVGVNKVGVQSRVGT